VKILQRFRARRRLLVGTVVLSVVATAGGVGLFAGVAGANAAPQVNFCSGAPSQLCLLPGSAAYGISTGTTGKAAPWFLLLNNAHTPPALVTDRWTAGDSIFVTVTIPGGTFGGLGGNDQGAGKFVEFAQTGSIAAVGQGCDAGVTPPTATVTAGTYSADVSGDAGLTDTLKITFTNSSPATGGSTSSSSCELGLINTANGPAFNLSYTVGVNTPSGKIPVAADYVPSTFLPAQTLANWVAGTSQAFINPTSNASVDDVSVTANVPPISVLPNAVNAPISPINIVETVNNQLQPGPVCVQLDNTGNTWSTALTPKFTVTPSTGGLTAGPVGVITDANNGKSTLIGNVVDSTSPGSPATWTFSNLAVNASGSVGPQTVTVLINATVAGGACTGTPVLIQGNQDFGSPTGGNVVAFSIGTVAVNSRIFGSVADQTAVAALEFQYKADPGSGNNCLPNNAPPHASQHDVGSSVVLATDQNWPDALTASYLASYLRSGVLLTPTGSLSMYTEQALRQEGVSTVFIVGGNLAVADSVQSQLAGTQQFQCGGTVARTDAEANPLTLNVTRIWGPTADDTAQDVSTFVNSGFVANLNISGVSLYNGFGTNPYNNTTGNDSISSHAPIPTIPVRTAILATDQSFQDAAAISSMSYAEHLPILITPPGSLGSQAQTGLLDLGIQQVIEPGGPVAISDAVNSSLESQGIDVLRLAGQDASDTSTQIARFEVGGYNGLKSPLTGTPVVDLSRNTGTNPSGLGWNNSCTTDGLTASQPELPHCEFTAALARGDFFADALTSSVVTGNHHEPVLLTEDPNTLGSALTAFFNQAGSPYGIDPQLITPITPQAGSGQSIDAIQPFGGPVALTNAVIQAALNAISAG
jgi:putative cell wall-binding protein